MAYTFHRATLSNGLEIIAEIDPHAHSAAAGFFVKTGARDEETLDMGVSHFLEHMMFKGTSTLSAEELNKAFDEIGARNNAFTSNEMTCFYAHVLPEALPRAVALLGTMMRPALRDEDFTTEKNVILEEIAMYKDNPFWVLYEACTEKHFGAHPLSHRVLGTAESITRLERNRMQGYFDSRYSADNTVVTLAGNLDFGATVSAIEERCGAWQKTSAARDSARPALVGGDFHLRDAKVNRGYVLGMCEGPAIADERRYASSLLALVLGMPDNSRLHWALIEPGIADEAQTSFDAHDGFGEYFVFATGEPDRLDEIWSIASREMRGLRDSLCQDDIDRLLNKFVTGMTLGGERPHDRMHRLGRMWMYLGRYLPLEAELDELSKVTLSDLRDVADAFPLLPVTVGRLSPT
jgi:predicted Zn-dependent peptidase